MYVIVSSHRRKMVMLKYLLRKKRGKCQLDGDEAHDWSAKYDTDHHQ